MEGGKNVVHSCGPQASSYIEPEVQLTRLCVGKPDVKHPAREMSICLDTDIVFRRRSVSITGFALP